jgi:5'-methylthioadenosine phosphorylase
VSGAGLPGADIGIFGGSGFYSLFDEDAVTVDVPTPFGAAAAPITIGDIGGVRVAFLARHGNAHEHLPHQVPARANVWAMARLGVRRIIGPCAAGSLAPHVHPGDFVVVDQLVDRTWGRPDTYYDQGQAHHVSFADPYCPQLRDAAIAAAATCSITAHDRGTVVVINGPRFATRAESRSYRAQGWEVINMTQYPEAYLARELGICYCGIALITDYDTGVEHDPGVEPVTQDQVFAFFENNLHRVRDLLGALIPALPSARTCRCDDARGPLAESPFTA